MAALPSIAPTGYDPASTPRVRRADFGDGYLQLSPDGLNSLLRRATVTWADIDDDDLDTLEAFFVSQGGYQSFTWTPPTGAAGNWICTTWKRPQQGGKHGVSTLTATFEETVV